MTEMEAALVERLARELAGVPAPSGALLDLRFLALIVAAQVVARGWRPTTAEPEPPQHEHARQERGWRCPPVVDDQTEPGGTQQ